MAGLHLVGVVALMWSANSKLIGDTDRTEHIMRETAQRADVSGEKIVCGDPNATPNDFVGYGILHAYAAVKRALAEIRGPLARNYSTERGSRDCRIQIQLAWVFPLQTQSQFTPVPSHRLALG
jgi:hypothetical protein